MFLFSQKTLLYMTTYWIRKDKANKTFFLQDASENFDPNIDGGTDYLIAWHYNKVTVLDDPPRTIVSKYGTHWVVVNSGVKDIKDGFIFEVISPHANTRIEGVFFSSF